MLRRLSLILPLLALGLALFAGWSGSNLRATLQHAAFDGFQRWQPRGYADGPMRIVDIDDASLARLGQWPWSRAQVAALLERLLAQGAAAVALDVVFAEPDRTAPSRLLAALGHEPEIKALIARLPDPDEALAKVAGSGPVATGFTTGGEMDASKPLLKARFVRHGDAPDRLVHGFPSAVANLPALERAAAGNGVFYFVPDNDGIVRRMPLLMRLGQTLYPSLAAEAIRLAAGEQLYDLTAGPGGLESVGIAGLKIDTNPQSEIWLHYSDAHAPSTRRRYLPAWQVLADQVASHEIAGRVILLGTSAKGLLDLRFNALGQLIPGVEIHGQAIEQMLDGSYLRRPAWTGPTELLAIAVGGVVLVLLVYKLGARWPAVVGGLLVVGLWAAALYAFSQARVLFDPLYPTLALSAAYLLASVPRHIATEREQRWIRKAFSSYVSPNLVKHLEENPKALKLGGERRECSFVLTDLESFTPLVEKSDPAIIVTVLNEYLDKMIRIVFEHEGTLDRIVGDAIAVMFSAPVQQPDHAERAVKLANAMHGFATDYSAKMRAQGIAFGKTRIGVNTGMVLVGNFGGASLFDYRAMGDPINTASRLESVNKQLGTTVLVSATTADRCPGFTGRPVGRLQLKGKSEGFLVYEPLTPEEAAMPAVALYRRAYDLLQSDAAAALTAFEVAGDAAPYDPLAAFHIERLRRQESGTLIVFAEK